ncbi:MAG: beta-propeller domain-containing protein [Marinagarivorans sp.]|nr:beta-propeller domain-containing protein [Marinagarivorans sp.]
MSSQYRVTYPCYNDGYYGYDGYSVSTSMASVSSGNASSQVNSFSSSSSTISSSSSCYAYSSSTLVLSSRASAAASSNAATGGSASGEYSQTNTHVMGVDEADIAKYDGEHWFVAVNEAAVSSRVDIYKSNANAATLDKVSSLNVHADATDQLYLVQNNAQTQGLALLRNNFYYYSTFAPTGYWGSFRANDVITLDHADVSNPAMPALDWSVEIDGSLIDSRKVGNTLYMVSRYEPQLKDTVFDYQDLTVRAANEAKIQAASLENLLPKARIGDTETSLSASCYLQKNQPVTNGFRSLIYITTIDLLSKKVVGSTCVNSSITGMSMTEKSLYLTGQWYGPTYTPQTVVHKFNVADVGTAYAATGNVEGSLNGSADPAFRLHEYKDDLRIVTSNNRVHKLFVLEQLGDQLQLVATLPNSARPEAIGKPNEDIKAVRFTDDMAQIVTFRTTDPLYTIDLSDRLDLKISGQIEVPGYATYIHPISKDYTFTLGYDASPRGFTTGLKIALYDISGDNPVEVKSYIYEGGGTTSEALYNLHALTVSPDKTRFVVPISSGYYPAYRDGFLLFEVNIVDGKASLNAVGAQLTSEQSFRVYRKRSVLHDDAVFMTARGKVWAKSWQSFATAQGQADENSFRCRTVEGVLQVDVENESGNACNAKVNFVDNKTGVVMPLSGSVSSEGVRCNYTVPELEFGDYKIQAELNGLKQEQAAACPTRVYGAPVEFNFQ